MNEINTIPREYGLRGSQKLLYLVLGVVYLSGAGFFFTLESPEVALVFGFLVLIPGLFLVSLALRSRLILNGDRLELRSALLTFTASRNEIEGLRKIEGSWGGHWTRICLKEHRGAFDVSESFTGNDYLNEWFKGLPDLDERDAAQITQQISQNSLKRAKAWTIALSIAAGIATIPVIFAPSIFADYAPLYNASLVLLVLFPPLGILLLHRFPLLFTLFKRKLDPRADMGFVIIFLGAGRFGF